MNNEIQTNEWYEELVSECKAIITEAVFTSRWVLVEGYWNLGKIIREEKELKKELGGEEVIVIEDKVSPSEEPEVNNEQT